MGAIRVSFLVLRRWCNLCPYAEIAACHCYTTFLWRRHYSITADTSATGLTANFHKRSTIFAENRSWGKPTPFSYILFFSVGTPKPTSEKTRPSREKEKVLQSYNNISRLEKQIFCQSSRLFEFSAILFTPWRVRLFLIQSKRLSLHLYFVVFPCENCG